MNRKSFIAIGIAIALAAGTVVLAQSNKPATQSTDSRIDKVIEQNEQILKNQDAIMKKLEELQTGINIVKRRTS